MKAAFGLRLAPDFFFAFFAFLAGAFLAVFLVFFLAADFFAFFADFLAFFLAFAIVNLP